MTKAIVIVNKSEPGKLDGFSAYGPLDSEAEAEDVMLMLNGLASDGMFEISSIIIAPICDATNGLTPYIKELME